MAKKSNNTAGLNMLFNPYKDDKKDNTKKAMATEKYGFMPKSVWTLVKDKKLVSYINDNLSSGSYSKGKKKKGQKELSLLNPNVVYQILKYYTEEGDVILAPYSSRGVVGLVANLMGRHSFNTEIVPTYHDEMVRRGKEAFGKSDNKNCCLEFYLDDAMVMKSIPDNFADLTFFNPPYFIVEKYESVDGQLSDLNDYDDFLEFYYKAIQCKFKKTRPGGWCIANLNDFRQPKTPGSDSEFIDFHVDTINLMKKAGFVMHDIIINEIFSRSLASIGSTEERGLKQMAKCHEYVMIFKKPFDDGTVWKSWHDYRENIFVPRSQEDLIEEITAWHKKKKYKVPHDYSWNWNED